MADSVAFSLPARRPASTAAKSRSRLGADSQAVTRAEAAWAVSPAFPVWARLSRAFLT